jgi:hypothetical protein
MQSNATEWIALSGLGTALDQAAECLLGDGSFVLEFELPLTQPTVLLDFQATEGWPRALSIFADPLAGIALLHRQGDRLARHALPGPLSMNGTGSARLVFGWNAPSRAWTLRLEDEAGDLIRDTRGRDPMPLQLADLLAICGEDWDNLQHRSVLWFGVRRGNDPVMRTPWIGLNTPVSTDRGPCRATDLRPGDRILTSGGQYAPLLSIRHFEAPSRGSFSPVLLRAPYFGQEVDLLVSANQLIRLVGATVEYLFGEDEVLAEARHLVDGRAALHDMRRVITHCVALDLGPLTPIIADGCPLLTHSNDPNAQVREKPFRTLRGYEAVPLMAALGNGSPCRAA